ncbi:MAG: DUF86 domain-containing protein [Deltaproteobacteria bacterium]|nr:DUF86 domain-containing protein [Deltaproteobacteria bacterium]
MPRDYGLYLEDIIEAVDRIHDYIQGMDEMGFSSDRKTQDAVIRNLEIIGEAARNLPDSLRAEDAEIEWRKIVGLRNILAHEYFGISVPIVWDIAQNKLRHLRDVCARLLTQMEND